MILLRPFYQMENEKKSKCWTWKLESLQLPDFDFAASVGCSSCDQLPAYNNNLLQTVQPTMVIRHKLVIIQYYSSDLIFFLIYPHQWSQWKIKKKKCHAFSDMIISYLLGLGKHYLDCCRRHLGIAQMAFAPRTQTGTLGHFVSEKSAPNHPGKGLGPPQIQANSSQNIGRGTTDPGYSIYNLSYLPSWIECHLHWLTRWRHLH